MFFCEGQILAYINDSKLTPALVWWRKCLPWDRSSLGGYQSCGVLCSQLLKLDATSTGKVEGSMRGGENDEGITCEGEIERNEGSFLVPQPETCMLRFEKGLRPGWGCTKKTFRCHFQRDIVWKWWCHVSVPGWVFVANVVWTLVWILAASMGSCHIAISFLAAICKAQKAPVYSSMSVLVFSVKTAELLICSVCCSHSCSLGYHLPVSLTLQTYCTTHFCVLICPETSKVTPLLKGNERSGYECLFPSHPAWNSPLAGLLTWEPFARV